MMAAFQSDDDAPHRSSASSRRLWKRWTIRLAVFAALWFVIAGSDPSSWIIGLPTVFFASWSSLRLSVDRPGDSGLKLVGLIWFLPYFAVESVRGGVDVAARVLRPRLKIDPGFVRYEPRLRHPVARVVFLDSVSLLPGTLSADLRDGVVEVHALDASTDLMPALQRLERLVARLFGEHREDAE